MNNYIDERFIPYQRPQMPIKNTAYVKKGSPLTRKHTLKGTFINSLRILASIFLLLLSTFSGDEVRKTDTCAGKVVKKCLIYTGVVLALWLTLVVMSNLVNAATLLPMWSLIIIFAFTILVTAGVKSK